MTAYWDEIYRKQMTDHDLMLALSFLYPSFVELEGCILLEEHLQEFDFAKVRATHNGKKHSIENVINTVDFSDMFNCVIPSDDLEKLVRQVAHLWMLKLHEEFPKRQFNIQSLDFSGDGAWGLIVTEAEPPQETS